MIDTTDYTFKVLLKRNSSKKNISELSKSTINDEYINQTKTNKRKDIRYRLNKSSNEVLNVNKHDSGSMNQGSKISSTSTDLSSSALITFTNHFSNDLFLEKKLIPNRKSSYLSNLKIFLEEPPTPISKTNDSIQNFYVKKMVDFGFNASEAESEKLKQLSAYPNKSPDLKLLVPLKRARTFYRIKSSQDEILKSGKEPIAMQQPKLKSSDLHKNKSFNEFSSSLRKKNKSSASKGFFSTSLIILPELDETLTNSSFNGLKDNLNYSSYNQDNFNNSDIIQFSDNNSKMSRQINSANKRNDLTLPPIVESKVSSTGTNFKKSNSINTRVDSGIAVEYGNDNPTSENEITTIEVVDSNGSLKKNATSSTLNSYGKSSSNQSKTSGNNNNNNKLGHNKSFKIANNSNDPNYLANIEKLNSLNVNNDEEYFTVNKKNNNNNDTSNKNQTNKQQSNNPKFDVLSRQNTVTTINNHETLPLVSKQQQNNGTNSSQSNSTQQQQKPVPKPRKNDKIPNGLHRQSTTLLPEQSQLMKESNDKKMLKRENTTITIKNPAAGSNQIARPKTGNANKIATVTFNINTESEFKPNRFNGDETETSKPLYIVKPDTDYSKLNDDNVDVVAALNLLEHDEAAMNEYTMMRIMKWLEDIENCNNMMQPPSQLAWNNNNNNNNNNNSNNKKADLPSDITRNFNSNEYALSDYDSLDEQIIEYNRVVDKTFNIVHDED